MPQTMLAFLAMMVASMAAFNHQLAAIRVQEERIRSEFEIMANAVALEAMELKAVPVGFDGLEAFDDTKGTSYFEVEDISEAFTLAWDVVYVDSNGDESLVPTDMREVSVMVYHERYPNRPLVHHTRIIGDN